MSRLLIVVGELGFESAWKERADPNIYELVIVDRRRQLIDTVVAVEVPEWYASLDQLIQDSAEPST